MRAQAAAEVAGEGEPEVVEEAEVEETEEPLAGEGEVEVESEGSQRNGVKTKALTKQVKHIMNVRPNIELGNSTSVVLRISHDFVLFAEFNLRQIVHKGWSRARERLSWC